MVRAFDDAAASGYFPSDTEFFIQTGSSSCIPNRANWSAFLAREEFEKRITVADLVITHGGTGAIVGAVKKKKRVVAIPRLSEFGEAVDDHQVELVRQFERMGIIKGCFNVDHLISDIAIALQMDFKPFHSNTKNIISSIDKYIQEEVGMKHTKRLKK